METFMIQLVVLMELFSAHFVLPTSLDRGPKLNAGKVWRILEHRDPTLAALHFMESTNQKAQKSNSECNTRTSLAYFRYNFTNLNGEPFRKHVAAATRLANILNILDFNKLSESQLLKERFLYNLFSSVLASDSSIFASGIAFSRSKLPPSRLFAPFAYHSSENSGASRRIADKDLAPSYNYSYDSVSTPGADWFWKQQGKNFTEIFTKRFSDEDLDVFSEIVNGTKPLLTSAEDGIWSSPYYECNLGEPSWIVSYSSPFFDLDGPTIVMKGVAVVSLNLQSFDLNQCGYEEEHMFSGTHRCDDETTMCIPVPGHGFHRGSYQCHCRPGYYFPDELAPHDELYFNGSEVEEGYLDGVIKGDLNTSHQYRCLPCKPGCGDCKNGQSCYVQYDVFLRSLPLGIQSFCMTIIVVLAITIFRLRKTKTISASMWTTLEMILLGASLLYCTVIIRYFEPSTMTCLLEPWFRELGFCIFYGAIILKIYRILTEFKSRKAHRVLLRDKDLLKYQAGIVLIVIGYMAAWTAINMDHIRHAEVILKTGQMVGNGKKYLVCKSQWWEYVTEAGELAFLLFGIYLSYNIRNAVSDCNEKRYLIAAIYLETTVSLILHVFRRIFWVSMNPDYIFLIYFTRCQITVTVILLLIFGSKLWYYHRPPKSEDHHRTYSTTDVHYSQEALKLRSRITSNGEVDVGEINLSEMNPEDIRIELKRVYTQLQVLRNKTMRKDNPHISKRRGGRKVAHRRFSLQAFHHKHKHHHEPEQETEVSKTPEESVCSVTDIQLDGPSGRYEGIPDKESPHPVPTVTFRNVRV